MDVDLFFKYIFPSVAISIGAYVAIRVDLARMTEQIVHARDRADEAYKKAELAHDRINSRLDKV